MPRAQRRCRHQGCDEPQPCPDHARAPDRRPSKQERGYDAEYDRAGETPEFKAATHCETCGHMFVASGGPYQKTKGHRKDIRKGGTTADGIFPQCAKCNYGWKRGKKMAGGRAGAAG